MNYDSWLLLVAAVITIVGLLAIGVLWILTSIDDKGWTELCHHGNLCDDCPDCRH